MFVDKKRNPSSDAPEFRFLLYFGVGVMVRATAWQFVDLGCINLYLQIDDLLAML